MDIIKEFNELLKNDKYLRSLLKEQTSMMFAVPRIQGGPGINMERCRELDKLITNRIRELTSGV